MPAEEWQEPLISAVVQVGIDGDRRVKVFMGKRQGAHVGAEREHPVGAVHRGNARVVRGRINRTIDRPYRDAELAGEKD